MGKDGSLSVEKYRILIADDEPIERMVVSKAIRNHFGDQMEIWQAVNGREAIELCRDKQCQIALLDISMPGIDGLEAAEIIRRENQNCSIIFLTAYDEFDFAKRAIRVQALDYLLKPGSREELIAVLEEAVAGLRCERRSRPTAVQQEDERQELVKNQVLLNRTRHYIETHYMEDICLQDAAAALHYSDVYFCKFFKQNFEKNFIGYLSELRVEKAKELLRDLTINIKDVSRRVGYHDSGYFTKVFKRITGVTPSEYRSGLTVVPDSGR